MIYINPDQIQFPPAWRQRAQDLTNELLQKPPAERSAFIEAKRNDTWGHHDVLNALRGPAGNKCWYSEVQLEGADPNVDHFRPKGRVVEVDCDTMCKTGATSPGYWWLAFEPRNFRLSCMHSNQRRVDENTEGGKADFFPVVGPRAYEGVELALISETVLPFDPCSFTDMALMWFDPEGRPGFSQWRRKPTSHETRRMSITVWLFHLDKEETARRRADHVDGIRADLKNADIAYKLWDPHSGTPDAISKGRFDAMLDQIKKKISDDAAFAGAKRCAVQIAKADYPWIQEFGLI